MGTVFLLALAAAVYPQLLAVVVLILTRPNPRSVLWACYIGALVVSIAVGIGIYAAFRAREHVLGTSSEGLGPAEYLVIGVVALVIAALVASLRGRELPGRDFPVLRRLRRRAPKEESKSGMWSKAERALNEGSVAIAVVVGMMLAIPGPFDLLALGHLARGGYSAVVGGAAILGFALIKFALIEIPIASYALDPSGTSARVGQFAGWMKANKLGVVAALIGVIGLVLIGNGVAGLV